ncbi:MAG: amidohydrolase [Acidimicrobiaceae bacterium]|nr:amidohydrolase [Acidimicrobiaceae bacterium]
MNDLENLPLPHDGAQSFEVARGAVAWRAGATFLPGRGFVEGVTVLVVDGIITAVTDGPEPTGAAAARPRPGTTLVPGLIDSHVHLTFSGGSAVIDDVVATSDVTLGMVALYHAQLALCRGVTTLADCGARGEVALGARDAVASGRTVGPRILASGAPITTTGGHCAILGGCADSLEDVIRVARRQVAAGADFLKLMLTGGNLTPGSNPGMLQYPAEVVAALAAEARRLSRPLVVHAHSAEAVALAGSLGASVVAHGTCATSEGIVLSPATIAALRAGGTAIDATITVGMPDDGDDGQVMSERAQVRKEMLPVFGALHDAGVPLLAGTDAGVTNVRHGATARAVLALESDVGLQREEALLAGTAHAARALGLGGLTGAIAPGLAADLLLLDGDLRHDPTAILRPAEVWVQGALVARHGYLALDANRRKD